MFPPAAIQNRQSSRGLSTSQDLAFMLRCGALVVSLCMSAALPAAEETPDALLALVRQGLAENFSLSVLLTEGEAISFGLLNFDPNRVLLSDNPELGSPDALAFRNSFTVYTLPWSFDLPTGPDDQQQLRVQGSYLVESENFSLLGGPDQDRIRNTNAGIKLGYIATHQLTSRWQVSGGLYAHWIRYIQRTGYATPETRALGEGLLDGLLTNIQVDALLAEPRLEFAYVFPAWQGRWELFSDAHYVIGRTVDVDVPAHETQPESWFVSNGIRMRRPLTRGPWDGIDFLLRLARVELGGNLEAPLGTDHYYEMGVGWLVNSGERIPFIEDFGLSLNFNYGSTLKGGSVVFIYNVE